MNQTNQLSTKVKIVLLFFAFLASLIIIVAALICYNIFQEQKELNELQLRVEEYVTSKYKEAKIEEMSTETSLKGEQLAYIVFEDEPNSTYIYGEGTSRIMQLGPNPPEGEKENYKYLEN
ncbi:DUF3139 domain-containing protein [Cytobacillus gottheilii]|uniref:DUF3139 domain-containing protein n=1 Tax=Cytobacillus gottheilii TaxID=859144 RepID=A0ABX8FHA7_9BACI|nr:DUF3139 domain-containing protein [Cytobacillus gottheilii]QVY63385.1 DUF3139 domain-containing protein [Cytobacillus gottheilii]